VPALKVPARLYLGGASKVRNPKVVRVAWMQSPCYE